MDRPIPPAATAGENARGASLMAISMTAFTINDTFLKTLADTMPLFQALFLRSVAVVAVLTLGAALTRGLSIRLPRRDRGLIALRCAAEVAAAYLFLTALFHMPIANVTAILQTLPLGITLVAALFLAEPIGWRRLSAILVGFVGVLLIVRPGTAGFSIYSLYALGAVGCVTVRDLAARRLSAGTPSITVALAAAVGVLVFSGAGSLFIDWAPVDAQAALKLSGSVLFVVVGYIASVMVMRVGDIGFTASFRYCGLLAALVLGFFVFGEWPQAQTLIGAAIIVASGTFNLWRERRLARRTAPVGLRRR
ncbi:DMT family transporter [Brevirhabdus sp.]|uniref:DMT family transporter n=1 Tax=Brevirhabdus sp. TaxID=2004514 RepID=UPI004059AD28